MKLFGVFEVSIHIKVNLVFWKILTSGILIQNQMENQRINEMGDFWLIQYQKLLDKKPKSIIEAVSIQCI